MAALREALPRTRTIVRADAGFAAPAIYEFRDRQGPHYLVGIGSNAVFTARTASERERLSERLEGKAEPPMACYRGDVVKPAEQA